MKHWLLRFIMIASMAMQWVHGLTDHLYREDSVRSEQGSFLGDPVSPACYGFLHHSSGSDRDVLCTFDHRCQLVSDTDLQVSAILPDEPLVLCVPAFQGKQSPVPSSVDASLSKFYDTSPLRGPPFS